MKSGVICDKEDIPCVKTVISVKHLCEKMFEGFSQLQVLNIAFAYFVIIRKNMCF